MIVPLGVIFGLQISTLVIVWLIYERITKDD